MEVNEDTLTVSILPESKTGVLMPKSKYPQDIVFQVHYLADKTPSGTIYGFAVFDTPPQLYKILPIKEGLLPQTTKRFKYIEFKYMGKTFSLVFHLKKAGKP